MEYKVDDKELSASVFVSFAGRIWPGDYDTDKTRAALSKTLNIRRGNARRLSEDPNRRLLFRNDHRSARTARISKEGDRQRTSSPCAGEYADNAVFRRAAGSGEVLRKERL